MPEIDAVIELLDARLPGSSANPLLAELTRGKPALKILNKQDLADPQQTAQWLAHYQAQVGTQALALDASATAPARQLIKACRSLAPLRGGMVKPMRVLICGIPNVGKSTLVNTLRGKRAAKTGDEAGITRTEQRIVLEDDFYLYDTPGMLWPRIAIEQSGYHLAASGAVGRNAYDDEEVALALLTQMLLHHADRLQARYKLTDMSGLNDEAVLAEIGRKRAPLLPGGRPEGRRDRHPRLSQRRLGAHHIGDAGGVRAVGGTGRGQGCRTPGQAGGTQGSVIRPDFQREAGATSDHAPAVHAGSLGRGSGRRHCPHPP
jgi:ribosome biogenesis GTPase A